MLEGAKHSEGPCEENTLYDDFTKTKGPVQH